MKYNNEAFEKIFNTYFKLYKTEKRFFPNGDLGALNEYNFENEKKMGSVQFWDKGYVSVLLIDLIRDETIINIMLSPEDEAKENMIFKFLLDSV